jgi:predicted PurR-regulated permease PerM
MSHLKKSYNVEDVHPVVIALISGTYRRYFYAIKDKKLAAHPFSKDHSTFLFRSTFIKSPNKGVSSLTLPVHLSGTPSRKIKALQNSLANTSSLMESHISLFLLTFMTFLLGKRVWSWLNSILSSRHSIVRDVSWILLIHC